MDIEMDTLALELEEGEVIPMDDQDSEDNINVIMPEKAEKLGHGPAPVAAQWTNISRTWRAEKSMKGRVGGLHTSVVAVNDQREIIHYGVEVQGGAHGRFELHRRKPTEEKQYEAEVIEMSEDEDSEGEGAVESENVEYTKRLAGPRMRMYADEEEEHRQRVAKIKRLYGDSGNPKEEKGRSLVVTVDVNEEEEDQPRPRGRQHEREWDRRSGQSPSHQCRYEDEDEAPVRRVRFPRSCSPSQFPLMSVKNNCLARSVRDDSERRPRPRQSRRSLSPDRRGRRSPNRHRTRDRAGRTTVRRHQSRSRDRSRVRAHRHRASAYSSSPSRDLRPVSRRAGLAARVDTRCRRRSRTRTPAPISRRVDFDERDIIYARPRNLRPENIGSVHRGDDGRRRIPVKDRLGW